MIRYLIRVHRMLLQYARAMSFHILPHLPSQRARTIISGPNHHQIDPRLGLSINDTSKLKNADWPTRTLRLRQHSGFVHRLARYHFTGARMVTPTNVREEGVRPAPCSSCIRCLQLPAMSFTVTPRYLRPHCFSPIFEFNNNRHGTTQHGGWHTARPGHHWGEE